MSIWYYVIGPKREETKIIPTPEQALDPAECVMVGNDVDEDMVVEALGMWVFLLTNPLINKSGRALSDFPNGGFDELKAFIEVL